MAWLAVDKDGRIYAHKVKPVRYGSISYIQWAGDLTICRDFLLVDILKDWDAKTFVEDYEIFCSRIFQKVLIKKESVIKLIGKDLTWDDEPIEI